MTTDKSRVFADALAFRRQLTSESDRACALMAGAYLDSQLGILLRTALVNDEAVLEEVLGVSKPLGSFSSRIDVAYLLGMLTSDQRRDLHLIRRIRNDFGHDPNPLSFESQAIASRCNELTYSYHQKSARPRGHFTAAVMGVLSSIHIAILSTPPTQTKPNHDDHLQAMKAHAQAKAGEIDVAFDASVEEGLKKVHAMHVDLNAQVQALEALIQTGLQEVEQNPPRNGALGSPPENLKPSGQPPTLN